MQYNEPWEIELRSLTGYTTIEDSDGTWICQPKDASAERIVACVNFCAGFSNEDLEKMTDLNKCINDVWNDGHEWRGKTK